MNVHFTIGKMITKTCQINSGWWNFNAKGE